jgi:hypothetical protein
MIGGTVLFLVVFVAAWALTRPPKPVIPRGPLPTIAVEDPVATTRAWFAAVDAENMPLAMAHYAPADRVQMEWNKWIAFNKVHNCQLAPISGGDLAAGKAVVECDFDTMGPDHINFLDVYLQRDSSGRWLIYDSGQG